MHLVGIALTGPGDPRRTALVKFRAQDEALEVAGRLLQASDPDIRAHVRGLADRSPVAVGLDAPLSYDLERGRRPCDEALDRDLREAGFDVAAAPAAAVPAEDRRALRGFGVARLLAGLEAPHPVWMVEVRHEGVLALRGAPLEALRGMEVSRASRAALLAWMESDGGLAGLAGRGLADTPAGVAACAAALGAWRWTQGRSVWLQEARPPYHPYDLAC